MNALLCPRSETGSQSDGADRDSGPLKKTILTVLPSAHQWLQRLQDGEKQ